MVSLQPGAGGLPRLHLAHPAGATAELYLHGAHLTSWVPAGGEEALFLSRAAEFRPGAAIRGGVPVIFPQFADRGPLPKHGFARTRSWEWVECEAAGHVPRAVLRLRDDDDSRALWPHPFVAELVVELTDGSLTLRLRVKNSGSAPVAFTAALHTYLRVGDVRVAALEGLAGVRFRSRAEGVEDALESAPFLEFAGEVDRVYLDAPSQLVVHDRAGGRTLRSTTRGFADVVVWNPWEARAASLPDMEAEEYREMLCVEAAQVGTAVSLAAGEWWEGEQRLEHERAS